MFLSTFSSERKSCASAVVKVPSNALENISSFLGVGRIGYVLEEIGFTKEEANRIALEDNALTHRNVYFPQSDIMVPEHKKMLKDVFKKISEKYHFQYKK